MGEIALKTRSCVGERWAELGTTSKKCWLDGFDCEELTNFLEKRVVRKLRVEILSDSRNTKLLKTKFTTVVRGKIWISLIFFFCNFGDMKNTSLFNIFLRVEEKGILEFSLQFYCLILRLFESGKVLSSWNWQWKNCFSNFAKFNFIAVIIFHINYRVTWC